MEEKDKLVSFHKEFHIHHLDGCPARLDWRDNCDCGLDALINADRKRIVEPLVKYKNKFPNNNRKIKCIDETLRLSGVEDEK